MKIIVGVDKGSYSITNNIITISGVSFTLESLLLITNVDTGEMLYNFASTANKATVSGSAITLTDGNDSSVSITNSTTLQIILEDSEPLVTSTSLVPESHKKVTVAYSGSTKTIEYFSETSDNSPVATLTVTTNSNGDVTEITRS